MNVSRSERPTGRVSNATVSEASVFISCARELLISNDLNSIMNTAPNAELTASKANTPCHERAEIDY